MISCLKKTAALLLVGLVVLAAAAPEAAARNKPWEKIKIPPLAEIRLPDYQRVELDNGMVLYLAEDHKFPKLELSATIRVGGLYDPADKVGLADLTGQVLRTGGTARWTGDEIDEMIESRGMVLETWIGDTEGGAFLSTLSEDTDLGLELLGEILMRPRFDPEKLELARRQAKAGISRRNDQPQGIAFREAYKVLYGADHPLARQPEYDTISAIGRDDLIAFHERYYHPDRVFLVVIGDFATADIVQRIEQAFASWPRATAPLPPEPRIQDPGRSVNVVDRPDDTQSNILVGHLGIRADDPDYAALQVGNRIMGVSFPSRMVKRIRTALGLAYSVRSDAGTGFRFPGFFRTYCGTKCETTQQAVDAIVEEIQRMTAEPVTTAELALAQDAILNSEVFNYDTKREILDRLALYEMNGYPADFLQRYQEQVRSLTPERIQEACVRHWQPDRLFILAVGNRAAFDGDLSKYGTVHLVDVTIPEPTLALDIPEPTPESLAAGQQLMSRAAAAMAGARLAQLRAYREKLTLAAKIQGMDLQIGIDKTVQFPDKQHVVQRLPFGEMTAVVNGDQGWSKSPMGEEEMSAEQLADAHKELVNDQLLIFKNPAGWTCQALPPAELDGRRCDVVNIRDAGEAYTLIYLDAATHLPYMVQSPSKSPMTQAPVTQKVYVDEYAEMDGYQVARRFTIKHDDELFATATVELFDVNPTIDAALFQK
jgi:zinc protease